jgi:glycosyltransferase involved in cell wall biosynthesis
MTYAKLGSVEPKLNIHSVCINLTNEQSDLSLLKDSEIDVIQIDSRWDFSWLAKCFSIIERVEPDLIFTHGFNGPVVVEVLRYKYKLNVPMVCSYHSEYQAPSMCRRFVAPVFNGAMHWIYRWRAVGVLGVSAFTKETLLHYGVPEAKIAYVLHGIAARPCARRSLQSLKPSWRGEEGSIILGVASRLDAIKGLNFLLQAFAIICKQCNVHLVVVGDGPEKQRLCMQASDLLLTERVTFVGYQANVADWLESFDVFCLPSLSETLSLSLIEALRAGLASVASKVGGIVEVVRNEQEALLVPPANAHALANALLRLARETSLRCALGLNARKRFEEEFTEDRMKRQLADWLLSFDRKEGLI